MNIKFIRQLFFIPLERTHQDLSEYKLYNGYCKFIFNSVFHKRNYPGNGINPGHLSKRILNEKH